MNLKIRFLLLIIGTFACTNNGFKKHESGLQYKFIEQNEEAQKPSLGDGLLIAFAPTAGLSFIVMAGEPKVQVVEGEQFG